MQADRRHLHHLIIDTGGSGRFAVLAMAAISLVLSALVFVQKTVGVGDLVSLVVLLLIAGGYVAGRQAGVGLLAGAYLRHNLIEPAE